MDRGSRVAIAEPWKNSGNSTVTYRQGLLDNLTGQIESQKQRGARLLEEFTTDICGDRRPNFFRPCS
jgi:hypothetical protein